MKKNILYYVPNKLRANPNVLLFAKANEFKCTIVATQLEFQVKYPDSAIIVYDINYKSQFDTILATMPKRNIIVADTGHLAQALSKFQIRQQEIDDIKNGLLSFLEYIDMPTINTSYILIKHTLFYMIDNNIEKCSYKILNITCANLGLDWQEEKPLLRKYCKIWYLQNRKSFEKSYPQLQILEFKTLHFINTLKSAYNLNYHKDTLSSLVLMKEKIDLLIENNTATLQDIFADDSQTK